MRREPFERVTKSGSVFSRTLRDDTVFLHSIGSTGVVCDDVNQSAETCPDDCTFSNGACMGAGQGFNFDPNSPSCDHSRRLFRPDMLTQYVAMSFWRHTCIHSILFRRMHLLIASV